MPDDRRRRLDNTIAAVQRRHGPTALRRGADAASPAVPHIATGFAALDAITGCGGVPLGAITLLSGRTTSGKLTAAYKVLANAQRDGRGHVAYTAVLLDLSRTADPDYLARCGLDLEALRVGRVISRAIMYQGSSARVYQGSSARVYQGSSRIVGESVPA